MSTGVLRGVGSDISGDRDTPSQPQWTVRASRFLVFPNENPWALKPSNSVQWHQEVGRWLHEYLSPQ